MSAKSKESLLHDFINAHYPNGCTISECAALLGLTLIDESDEARWATCLDEFCSRLVTTYNLIHWLPVYTGMSAIIAVQYQIKGDWLWSYTIEYQMIAAKGKPFVIDVLHYERVLAEFQDLFEWKVNTGFSISQAQLFCDYIGRGSGDTAFKRAMMIADALFIMQHNNDTYNPTLPIANIDYYIYWLQMQYISYVKEAQSKQKEMVFRRDFTGFIASYEAKLKQGEEWDNDFPLFSNQYKETQLLLSTTIKRALEKPNPIQSTIQAGNPYQIPAEDSPF
jgi:hypothetical protein